MRMFQDSASLRRGGLLSLAALLWLAWNAWIGRGQTPLPNAQQQCGPPHYCARTDRRLAPYPQNPPPLGPAGSVITDPDFGSRILRVTDDSGDHQSYHSPASAEQNPWNANSTKFYVGDGAGNIFLFDFDPATMAERARGRLKLPWREDAEFSSQRPNILYGVTGSKAVLQEYDLSSGRASTVADPADCVKVEANYYGSDVSTSADDQRMMWVVGPRQDLNPFVYVYDRKQGCRWYNTTTGEVGGAWGPKGTITNPERFSVHDARISKSGQYVGIVVAGGMHRGPAFWDVGTLNVTDCLPGAAPGCTGHHVMGYSHFLNSANNVHPLDFVIRPISDLTAMRHLINDLPHMASAAEWYDYHLSWNHIDSEDDTPACFSTYRYQDNPTAPGAPLTVKGPWDNEIDCVEIDGKASTVWRFAHAYSSGKNGFWSTPRGNVSLDGRFYLFTSDWESGLGSGPGGSRRTDAFIVQLR
jgi:hypothetical protein